MGKARKYSEIVFQKPIPVKCPYCGAVVAHDDGRQEIDIVARCDRCRVRIVYDVSNGLQKDMPLPERNCSSGVTYR
jgi:hypothetical protein